MRDLASLEVHEDIREASTLPAWIYSDAGLFAHTREAIFARSWQLVTDTDRLRAPGQVLPFTLLEGTLDEPLFLARDEHDALRVPVERVHASWQPLVESVGVERVLRCRYHGRRFGLDGRFMSMPEFEEARRFPSPADDLPSRALRDLGQVPVRLAESGRRVRAARRPDSRSAG